MPFVEGETLRARLERERQLPVDEAMRIALRGRRARSTTRTRTASIHRDLKPENILLQDGQPLVADFGIALAVQQGRRRAHHADGPLARHAAVHESRAGDGRPRHRRAQPTSTRSAR